MKSHLAYNDVQTNMQGSNAFTIQASGKAFQILSSGIYTDKISAILREIGCNAYDAHVEVGKTNEPFDLHFPTVWEPYLEIKDYGPGLPDYKVRSLYTTYFDSTKNNSNDVIGSFGLGSKSPFSYTDSFTVESRYNGISRNYIAYIGNDGIPQINKVDECNLEPVESQLTFDFSVNCIVESSNPYSDTPNGMTINVPVQRKDFAEFKNRAKEVFKYFPIKPNVNISEFTFNECNYILSGEDWGKRNERIRSSNSMYAIQGNVAYPIKKDMLKTFSSFNEKLDLYFDIGELEPTPSREELSYDDKTIENIEKRLQKVVDSFQDEVQSNINDCDSLWEARKMFHNIVYNNFSTSLQNQIVAYYDNVKLDIDNVDCKFISQISGFEDIKLDIFTFNSSTSFIKNARKRKEPYQLYPLNLNLNSDNKLLIVFDDLSKGGVARCKHLCKTYNSKKLQVLLVRNWKNDPFLIQQMMKYIGKTF